MEDREIWSVIWGPDVRPGKGLGAQKRDVPSRLTPLASRRLLLPSWMKLELMGLTRKTTHRVGYRQAVPPVPHC